MKLPTTESDLLVRIATETARMSYPGSMSRGTKPVVRKGTKRAVEVYFIEQFPLAEVWSSATSIKGAYEAWHRKRVSEIASAIESHVPKYNQPESVGAKFLNTFMHQLMKYERCRALWTCLHLPLDRRVFVALQDVESPALDGVRALLDGSPYAMPYEGHLRLQGALLGFIDELNRRPDAEFRVSSRIELNWLWT